MIRRVGDPVRASDFDLRGLDKRQRRRFLRVTARRCMVCWLYRGQTRCTCPRLW